jgi:hypothetical protein
MAARNTNTPEKRNGASGKDARPRPPSGKRSTTSARKPQARNGSGLRKAKPSTESMLSGALVEFVRAEAAFTEGLKKLSGAQNDFEVCAKNKNLYSHALRALRHIAKHPCESGDVPPTYSDCEAAIAAGAEGPGVRCWPCFARDALRQGGNTE